MESNFCIRAMAEVVVVVVVVMAECEQLFRTKMFCADLMYFFTSLYTRLVINHFKHLGR